MFASHQIKGMYLIKSFVSDLTFVLFFLLKLEKLKKKATIYLTCGKSTQVRFYMSMQILWGYNHGDKVKDFTHPPNSLIFYTELKSKLKLRALVNVVERKSQFIKYS